MTPDRIQSFPPPERSDDLEERQAALRGALEERILVLDGATGTGYQAMELTAEDFGGPELEGCNENLCRTRPDAVETLHRSYLEAGADIVETNSFGSTPLVLDEYGLGDRAFELNRLAAELARRACEGFDGEGRLRFVCGSMGPTTKALSVTGGVSFEELVDHYRVQASGLMAGGADYLLLETCQDTRNVKAGLLGIERARDAAGWSIPVAISATIELTGTMLGGQDPEALAVSVAHVDLLYLGLNCATGPERMRDHVRTLSELARTRVACVPNAGLPDEEGRYDEGPEEMASVLEEYMGAGWLNLVGGCCGTTPDHVRDLVESSRGKEPRPVPDHDRCFVSGIEAVELTSQNRPLLVGERTNVLGSRKFREFVEEGAWERAAEVGRDQVRSGAQVLDVCLQDPDREETEDMESFLELLTRLVKVPLMIDSTDPEVMARALTWCQGKSVLNSINLEDGRERLDPVATLARRFGAALVVGTIDEDGMAVTVERKLEVARRCHRILVEDHGMRPEDLWWDPLVFPCGTGDESYVGAARATLEAVGRLKELFPSSRTILGISNVSFGLPTAGREILNSVFLYHATKAGLDAAIVNTEGLARYAEIPDEERALAERFLELERGQVEGSEEAVATFTAHFRDRDPMASAQPREDLPLEERIARAVVEGTKEGLEEDLQAALDDSRWPEPLEIINGPLMEGMGEVGRLFNDNQLIVAEVLQSAEVMKAAVSFLEEFMEASENGGKGTVLLATVKGDVHDIGKNLVEIILENNGFRVVNLGIKVPSERLIEAVREHDPDVIGLSGLLVKSAQQMVLTAGDFEAAEIQVPLLVGGAALSRRFTHRKIAAAYSGLCTYAKDAMHGLDLVERLLDPERRPALNEEVADSVARDREKASQGPGEKGDEGATRSRRSERSTARRDLSPPEPPDLDRHVELLDLDAVWEQMNRQMLFTKYFGLKGVLQKREEADDPQYRTIARVIEEIQEEARSQGILEARAVWRFFPARSSGNELWLLDPESGEERARWDLPRQEGRENLCLADYVLPDDHLALFVTTAGEGVRERAQRWKEEGEYLRSHALASLALETAEAAAEWLHMRLREAWGFPDPPEMTKKDRFAVRYRGCRYSFGYPACPDIEGQRALFSALEPEEIGVHLTEGDMMEPEASVSALVFHHPDAKYFSV